VDEEEKSVKEMQRAWRETTVVKCWRALTRRATQGFFEGGHDQTCRTLETAYNARRPRLPEGGRGRRAAWFVGVPECQKTLRVSPPNGASEASEELAQHERRTKCGSRVPHCIPHFAFLSPLPRGGEDSSSSSSSLASFLCSGRSGLDG